MPRAYQWEEHRVQWGDTLSALALQYGVTVSDIAQANGILNPDLIYEGSLLKVRKYYVVVEGDTLSEIAWDFAISLDDLLAFNRKVGNPFPNPDLIYPGDIVYLPGPYTNESQPAPSGGEPAKPAAAQPSGDPLASNPSLQNEAVAYDDDIVPPHRRLLDSPSFLAIGDVQFIVPPSFIHVTASSNVEEFPGLRQKGSVKTKSGYGTTEIRIELYFVGVEQINGIPVPGPEGGNYYMDGLRALLAQFKKCPILPIQNQYLNAVYDVETVALVNLIVSTVEGFPGCLKAELVLHKSTVEPYLNRPDGDYPLLIQWPVFRWYYQQMITDKRPARKMTYLEPVQTPYLTGAFRFHVLDDNIFYENQAGVRTGNFDDDANFQVVDFGDGFVVNGMTVSMANRMATLQTQLQPTPCHQYLGGVDTVFLVNILCTDEALRKLHDVKATAEDYSIRYRNRMVSGFVKVENELVQLFGVNYVMIAGIESETIENNPGWNAVTLHMVSYDKTQYRNESLEQLKYVEGSMDDVETVFEGDLNHIDHAIKVEQMMNSLELYPDLELPTYQEANAALKAINAQREANGLQPLKHEIKPPVRDDFAMVEGIVYVDPDFYMAYSGILPGGLPQAAQQLADMYNETSFYGETDEEPLPPPEWKGQGETVLAVRVKDGDTFVVKRNGVEEDVRLIWVDAPEHKGNRGAEADQPFAKEAQQALSALVENKMVHLELGIEPRDQYGRLLAYVWTETGASVQYELLKKGLVRRLEIAPNTKYANVFESIMRQAQRNKTGIWSLDAYTKIGADPLVNDLPYVQNKKQTADRAKVSISSYLDFPLDQTVPVSIMEVGAFLNGKLKYNPGSVFEGQEAAFIRAQEVSGLNIAFILALFGLESQWGTSPLAKERHNFASYKAFDEDIVTNYHRASSWANLSVADAIVQNAVAVAEDFVKNQKRRTIRQLDNYATDPGWESKLVAIMEDFMPLSDMIERSGVTPAQLEEVTVPDWVKWAGKDREDLGTIVSLDYEPAENDTFDTDEKLLRGVMHDAVRYGRYGRLIRAFPTYCLLFVDEGLWMDGRRLWTRYFAYHSLVSISVVKERDNPADTCHIILNNVYSTLDKSEKFRPADAGAAGKGVPLWEGGTLSDTWGVIAQTVDPKITQDMIEYRKQAVEHAAIRPGARLHLRMGYGSAASDLPVIGNFTVAEINAEDVIELVAQGDGIELTNVFTQFQPDDHNSLWNFGNEPHDIICGIMTERDWVGRFFGNFGEVSPFGIEHFGILKKYRALAGSASDAPYMNPDPSGAPSANWSVRGYDPISDKGRKVRLKDWVKTKTWDGLPFWLYNDMDICKNIYSSNYKAYVPIDPNDPWYTREIQGFIKAANKNSNSDIYKFWDFEKNMQMYIGNRTPWDIFTTVAKTVPDYIVAVYPHQFRSTLFFGLPHYPIRYGYVYAKDYKNHSSDDYDRYRDRCKPFIQFHAYSSDMDIIHNGIKASARHLVHNCAAQYTLGGSIRTTKTVCADDTIKSDQIRTEVIDTGILNDLMLPIPDSWLAFIGINNGGADRAEEIAKAHVRDSFKEMYQGYLLILGDPSVKPHDLFSLSDSYTDMMGTALVGKVVHEMSIDTGFTTSIKPDLVTALVGSPAWNVYKVAQRYVIPWTFGVLKSVQLYKAIRVLANYGIDAAGNIVRVGKFGWISRLGLAWANMGRDLAKGAEIITKWAPHVVDVGKTRGIMKAIRSARNAGRVVAGATALGTAGAALVALVAWEAAFIFIEKIIGAAISYVKNRNVINIYPLWYQGLPYTAGVDGHRRLIPGLQDPFYYPAVNNDSEVSENPGRKISGVPVPEPAEGVREPGFTAQFVHPVNLNEFHIDKDDIFGSMDAERAALGLPPHQGLDYKPNDGQEGHSVYAIAAGTVESVVYEDPDMGNNVRISHEGNIVSWYAHMKTVKVKEGARVKQGQIIGTTGGASGQPHSGRLSTGPHLHLGIFVDGLAQDPLKYIRTDEYSLPERQLHGDPPGAKFLD